ncbi:hypothetical protein [Kutzneria buriramensis]|uniref:Ternary complex associated domain-containing protein n=1 Tax=Kutzneria buriramensis TaxID=1045776 RepID=A0A3E0GVN1_9PSEU|nr:hypothetical protein [Kutzneria buriramensis]REH29599.1 hypothetical protein BCF44_12426 [Kutzneria buriramensis]
MPAVEIRFAADCGIADVDQPEIESVLSRIPVGSGPGHWPESVRAVEVARRLTGGRSGSEVLDIRVYRADSNQSQRFVAKLGSLAATGDEWQAYHRHFAEEDKALLLKIKAVTTGALGRPTGLAGDREAVVYQHISDFAAEPDGVARTLEDVVTEAFDRADGATAVRAVGKLMRQAVTVLYHGVKADARARMRHLNRQLGTDIVVEVDNITKDGQLRFQYPQPAELLDQRQHPRAILSSACTVAPEPPLIRAGELIWLPLMELRRHADGWLGLADEDVTVEIRTTDGLLIDELVGQRPVELHGRVVRTRATHWWQQLTALLPTLAADQDGIVLDGVRIGHPLRHVDGLLGGTWVSSLVHGDLNPRNIMLVGDLLCLIDYARTATGKPLLSDPAWLEISLLRDVLATRLTRPELVRLQRLLAVASRLPVDTVLARIEPVLATTSPRFALAFRLLWEVRRGAREAYPLNGHTSWRVEYLGALTLGACRTFKWLADEQDPDAVAAAVIAAGVAAEQLKPGAGGPFGRWTPAELAAVTMAFAHEGRPGDEAVLADLVLAVDAMDADTWPAGLAETLNAARAELTRTHCAAAAQALLPGLRRERGPFIPLRARVGQGPEDEALTVVAGLPTATLIGDAGSGKSTVLRELRFQLVATVAGDPDRKDMPTRMPVLVRASDITRDLHDQGDRTVDPGEVLCRLSGFVGLVGVEQILALLAIGGLHLMVDGVDELSITDSSRFLHWLRKLRRRYPRAPLVVCQRTARYRTEVFDFPLVRLGQVELTSATAYVEEALRSRGLSDDGELLGRLTHSPEYRQLRELTRTPLFLWMIVEWYAGAGEMPTAIGDLFAEFTDWYLTERHHPVHERGPKRFDLATKSRVLQAIASNLVSQGNITELPQAEVHQLCADLDDLDAVLAEIVDCEILHRENGRLRFLHQLFQEYFAACALAGEGPDELGRRVLAFDWREPIRILVSAPTTHPDTVDFVLRQAVDTDPRYGAWLLRAAKSVSPEFLASFVDQQAAALRSCATGEYGWHRSARALVELGTQPALAALVAVATDVGAPQLARAEVVDVMVDACHTVPEVETGLRTAVAAALTADTPEPVMISALRATAEARLTANIGVTWELVDPARPWPVVNAAHRTLTELGATLSPAIDERYVEAAARRLDQVERDLLGAVRTDEIDRLQDDRLTVLTAFAGAGRLADLLVRRFGYGLADRPEWPVLLATAATHPAAAGSPAARLITEPATEAARQSWREVYAGDDEPMLVAAAHRLLADGSVATEELLAAVEPASPASRLLVAAALVESAVVVDSAATLVSGVIDRVDESCPELLEPLAALVSALNTAGHPARLALACRASEVLRQRNVRQSMCWPWAHAWCDITVDDTDIADLLRDEQGGIAAECLNITDFLLTACARPAELHVSPIARQQLHALRPASPHGPDASRFVLTVAHAGLVELLPYVESVASSAQNQATLLRHVNSAYGVLDIALASHAVSAIGYLGRVLADSRKADGQDEYRFLRGLDTTDLHPSIRQARLVGLGFLGDWQHILDELTAERVLLDAAENIVAHWLPGPFTPSDQGPADIAEWISGRLARADLDARVRSTLERIKVGLESIAGHYVSAAERGEVR